MQICKRTEHGQKMGRKKQPCDLRHWQHNRIAIKKEKKFPSKSLEITKECGWMLRGQQGMKTSHNKTLTQTSWVGRLSHLYINLSTVKPFSMDDDIDLRNQLLAFWLYPEGSLIAEKPTYSSKGESSAAQHCRHRSFSQIPAVSPAEKTLAVVNNGGSRQLSPSTHPLVRFNSVFVSTPHARTLVVLSL